MKIFCNLEIFSDWSDLLGAGHAGGRPAVGGVPVGVEAHHGGLQLPGQRDVRVGHEGGGGELSQEIVD